MAFVRIAKEDWDAIKNVIRESTGCEAPDVTQPLNPTGERLWFPRGPDGKRDPETFPRGPIGKRDPETYAAVAGSGRHSRAEVVVDATPVPVVPHAARLAPPDRSVYKKDYAKYVEDYKLYLRELANFKNSYKTKVEQEKKKMTETHAAAKQYAMLQRRVNEHARGEEASRAKTERQKAAKRARNRRQRKRKAQARIDEQVELAKKLNAISVANQGVRRSHLPLVPGQAVVDDGWKVVVNKSAIRNRKVAKEGKKSHAIPIVDPARVKGPIRPSGPSGTKPVGEIGKVEIRDSWA